MESVRCNLCENDSPEPFAQVPDLLLERLNINSNLVKCKKCGLVYQNPRPTAAEIGEHYPLEYESYTDQTVTQKSDSLLQRAIQYGIQKRCRFVTRHKQGGQVLDIGCGTGTFLVGMRQQGNWQPYGVELNPEVARMASERHQLNIFAGTLEQAAFPANFFDAVTLWDVFEHLHDPLATLSEIQRVLKPDGLLLIRVPNLASWDANLFGKYWAGLDAPRHLYIFTPTILTQMLAKGGFGIVNHSCAIGSYVTFVLSVRFWLSGHQAPAWLKTLTSRILYHPLLRIISAPFFYIPSLLLRGPLLVTTARKE